MRSVISRTRTPHSLSATATGLIAAAPALVAIAISSPWSSTLLTPSTLATTRRAALAIAVDTRHDEVVADLALELGGRALGDQVTAVEDADAIGELVGLFEVLRGEEDRHAELLVQLAHLLPHAGAADGIETRGGLVEEQHLGVVHERGREVEPPLHAAGIRADLAIERVADVDHGRQLLDPLFGLPAAQAVEAPLEPQQLDAGLLAVERDVLEGDADAQPHLLGLGRDVVAGHDRAATGRRQQRAEHADGGGLAGRVRPEEAVDLPGATSRSRPSTAASSSKRRSRPATEIAAPVDPMWRDVI